MDCDDIAHPERFEGQWQAIQEKANAVLSHTQIHIIGEARYVTPAARFIRSEALTMLRLCYQCPIVHPTVMFRKDAFLGCGGYLPEERHAEDFSLWGRLIAKGNIVGIPRPLLSFRVHSASISKQKADVQIPLSRQISLRHCRQFLSLNEEDARRAMDALRYYNTSSTIRDWLWLLSHCLPRLRSQSFELWIWAAQATVRRFFRELHR
jgi:hypothetical protein